MSVTRYVAGPSSLADYWRYPGHYCEVREDGMYRYITPSAPPGTYHWGSLSIPLAQLVKEGKWQQDLAKELEVPEGL